MHQCKWSLWIVQLGWILTVLLKNVYAHSPVHNLNVTQIVSVRITFWKRIIQYQCNKNNSLEWNVDAETCRCKPSHTHTHTHTHTRDPVSARGAGCSVSAWKCVDVGREMVYFSMGVYLVFRVSILSSLHYGGDELTPLFHSPVTLTTLSSKTASLHLTHNLHNCDREKHFRQKWVRIFLLLNSCSD